jgi:hypothetical protein
MSLEKEIRKAVNRPRGDLNQSFLEEVTMLDITEYQLTDVSPLMGFTQLKSLSLLFNPNLAKVEIDKLQKALPNCRIYSNPKR